MNKKFMYLTKYSMLKKLKSKWFIIVNISLLILIIALANIDSIISFFGGDFDSKTNVVVIDNTNDNVSSLLKEKLDDIEDNKEFNVKISKRSYKDEVKKIDDKIIVVLDTNSENYLEAQVVSDSKINTLTYQYLTTSLGEVKYNYALLKSNIDSNELLKISTPISIKRVILDEDKKADDENLETIMGAVFPTLILPFFMLIIFLVQMIGAEIYEEKSTRSMEIIISNVPAKAHFASKIVSSNLFVIIQGLLLLLYSGIAFFIRNFIGGSASTEFTEEIGEIWNSLSASGFTDKLIYIIPISLVLLLLSFLVYSITAGLLASLTVNMEDYQQIQTPLMLLLIVAYYLAIMSSMFNGSTLIRILSYIPFISCLLSPSLLVLGQISIVDSMISILVLIIFDYLLLHKGIKIYKVGILNYSNEKIWTKLKKVVKIRD